MHFVVCNICGRGVTIDEEAFTIAKTWGFFLCGMAKLNHDDENFVRTTLLETRCNCTTRKDLFTHEVVDLFKEIGM